MEKKINLTESRSFKQSEPKVSHALIWESIAVLGIVIILTLGLFTYSRYLTGNLKKIQAGIVMAESKINSLKEVEEQKSLLTKKTDEIQKLYEARLDYLDALSSIEKMFGYSLAIKKINIKNDATAEIEADKISEITLSSEEAFKTPLKELLINVSIPSSNEITSTIENLRQYQSQGLRGVVLMSSELKETGGYMVRLKLLFGEEEKLETTPPLQPLEE